MPSITAATEAAVIALLTALAALIAIRLLNGEINTRGLLARKGVHSTDAISPERVQLLLSIIATAGLYAGEALANRGRGHLPDVPTSFLAGLGVSNAVYLGAKALTTFTTSTAKIAPPPSGPENDTSNAREPWISS